ncbi:uncharacterized protein LOC108677792 isoform X2 [Hyalella azteca]|uniref:Uncharacterized protein LOC108677792 isoform X2 n=1 Tax=Hyalella azteca TaxID=294128 RepID=A0A8B7P6K0_HYAAZ|nr:uncharacterized protein LOC108677792 isoform X2 [Hyalella azteca]
MTTPVAAGALDEAVSPLLPGCLGSSRSCQASRSPSPDQTSIPSLRPLSEPCSSAPPLSPLSSSHSLDSSHRSSSSCSPDDFFAPFSSPGSLHNSFTSSLEALHSVRIRSNDICTPSPSHATPSSSVDHAKLLNHSKNSCSSSDLACFMSSEEDTVTCPRVLAYKDVSDYQQCYPSGRAVDGERASLHDHNELWSSAHKFVREKDCGQYADAKLERHVTEPLENNDCLGMFGSTSSMSVAIAREDELFISSASQEDFINEDEFPSKRSSYSVYSGGKHHSKPPEEPLMMKSSVSEIIKLRHSDPGTISPVLNNSRYYLVPTNHTEHGTTSILFSQDLNNSGVMFQNPAGNVPRAFPSTQVSPQSPQLPLNSGLHGQGSQDSGIASCGPTEDDVSLCLAASRRVTMGTVSYSSDSSQWLGSLESDGASVDGPAVDVTSMQCCLASPALQQSRPVNYHSTLKKDILPCSREMMKLNKSNSAPYGNYESQPRGFLQTDTDSATLEDSYIDEALKFTETIRRFPNVGSCDVLIDVNGQEVQQFNLYENDCVLANANDKILSNSKCARKINDGVRRDFNSLNVNNGVHTLANVCRSYTFQVTSTSGYLNAQNFTMSAKDCKDENVRIFRPGKSPLNGREKTHTSKYERDCISPVNLHLVTMPINQHSGCVFPTLQNQRSLTFSEIRSEQKSHPGSVQFSCSHLNNEVLRESLNAINEPVYAMRMSSHISGYASALSAAIVKQVFEELHFPTSSHFAMNCYCNERCRKRSISSDHYYDKAITVENAKHSSYASYFRSVPCRAAVHSDCFTGENCNRDFSWSSRSLGHLLLSTEHPSQTFEKSEKVNKTCDFEMHRSRSSTELEVLRTIQSNLVTGSVKCKFGTGSQSDVKRSGHKSEPVSESKARTDVCSTARKSSVRGLITSLDSRSFPSLHPANGIDASSADSNMSACKVHNPVRPTSSNSLSLTGTRLPSPRASFESFKSVDGLHDGFSELETNVSSLEEKVKIEGEFRSSESGNAFLLAASPSPQVEYPQGCKGTNACCDEEDLYPRDLDTSEYSGPSSRKPARFGRALADIHFNSSQKKKRRIRTRRRSSGRQRASKMLLESRASKRLSRCNALASDPAEVYSQPVDSIEETTIVQPRAVIATQPRRLSHRKHRVASSTLNVGLPLLDSPTIAGSGNAPLGIAANESFTRSVQPRLTSTKQETNEKKKHRKFLSKKHTLRVCETTDFVQSKESFVRNVGTAHCTSLMPSPDIQHEQNLLLKSKEDNGADVIASDLPSGNGKSTKRMSRKDKHEHRSLCRLLPFVGMRWCQRKEDHSSESREGVYVASDSVASLAPEEKKRSFLSNLRYNIFSFLSVGSSEKSEIRTGVSNVLASEAGCGNADDICVASKPSPLLPPNPSDLLNHSNYSAFTRAPARLPSGESHLSVTRGCSEAPDSMLPPFEGIEKETLEVLTDGAAVGPTLPPLITATTAHISADLNAIESRSPQGPQNHRTLPPLPPKSNGTTSPPHPPIPPPLPQAILSAVAVTPSHPADVNVSTPLLRNSSGTEAADDALPNRNERLGEDGCHFASMIEKVKDYGWYWGPISGKAAEKIVSNEPDGSFIVRDSSDDHYIFSLTFKLNGLTRHVRIEHDQGNFSFGGFTKFKSQTIVEFIESAIEHSRSGRYLFFLHRRPVLGPRRVQLLHPVSRYRRVQSLQHLCRFVIVKSVRRDRLALLPLPERLVQYLSSPHYYSELVDQLMAEEEEEEKLRDQQENDADDLDARREGEEPMNAVVGENRASGGTVDEGNGNVIDPHESIPRRDECANANTGCSPCKENSLASTRDFVVPDLDDPEDEIGVICNPFECSAVVEALHPLDQGSSVASLDNDVHEICFVHCQEKEQSSLCQPCESPAVQAKCSCASGGVKANVSSFCRRCIVHSPRSICVGGHRLPVEQNQDDNGNSGAIGESEQPFVKILTGAESFSLPATCCEESSNSAKLEIPRKEIRTKDTINVTKFQNGNRRPLSMSSFLCNVPKKVNKIVSYQMDLNSDGPTLIKFTKLVESSSKEFHNPLSVLSSCTDSEAVEAAPNNKPLKEEKLISPCIREECVRVCAVDATYSNVPLDNEMCATLVGSNTRRSVARCSASIKSSLSPVSPLEDQLSRGHGEESWTTSIEGLTKDESILHETPLTSVIVNSSLEELGNF